jgi:hypothetical protein
MNYKHLVAITVTLYLCCTFSGYCQNGTDYSAIETENVLSYKVDEIIVMRFGGSRTHYNVSDIRLISKVDLGPGNIRVITPVYKDGKSSKKVYVEVMSATKRRAKERQKNAIFEITVENNQTKIANNPNATPAETEALLAILKKVIPNNKVAYEKTQAKDPRQNGTQQQIKTSQKTRTEKVVLQNAKKEPAPSANGKNVTRNQLETQPKIVGAKKELKNLNANNPADKKPRILPERVVVAKKTRISNATDQSKRNTRDSIYRSKREARLKVQNDKKQKIIQKREAFLKAQRDKKARVIREKEAVVKPSRVSNVVGRPQINTNDTVIREDKEPRLKLEKEQPIARIKESAVSTQPNRNPRQTSRVKSDRNDSIFEARKVAELKAKKEKRTNSKTTEDKSEPKSSSRSCSLKEKNNKDSEVEGAAKKTSKKETLKKEPKIKLKKESKKRSRQKVKSRRRGKIKVAQESVALRRVRYDKTKYSANTAAVKDSVGINVSQDSLKIAERKKTALSTKSFNLNKVRNSKPTDEDLRRNLKEAVSMDSRKSPLVTVKKEKKTKVVSPDSLAIKSITNKKLKETATKKEVASKPVKLVTEVNKIKTVVRNPVITIKANALKPSTLYSLSTMVPKSIIKVDSLSINQTSVVINVIATYERIAKKGYKSADLFQKIADSYFFKGEMEIAVLWYEKLFDLKGKLDPIYYYRFGTALKTVGQTTKSEELIYKFNQLQK